MESLPDDLAREVGVLKELFPEPHGPGAASLLSTEEALLNGAPVGLTVVSREGRILYVNAYQRTLPDCPWIPRPGWDARYEESVPAPVRTGLRRMLADGGTRGPVQLPPFSFTSDGALLETWLVPIEAEGRVAATVILQHPRDGARLDYRSARSQETAPEAPAAPFARAFAPPALDVPMLRRVFSLTNREVQIVDALCRGRATPEIAADMGISAHTVKDHVKRIQRKMQARNRLTIVSRALHTSLQPS